MTITNQTSRWIYNADGVTTNFTYDNRIFAAGDLQVSVGGVVQSSGFTVTGVDNSAGGSVVFTTAPTGGANAVVIERIVPTTQGVALPNLDPLAPSSLERALDRLTVLVQQVQDKVGRSLRLKSNSTFTGSLDLPDPVADTYLSFDAALKPVWAAGTAVVGAATSAVAGIMRFATTAEAQAGTDTRTAITPAGAASAFLKRVGWTQGNIVYADNTGALVALAPGAAGQVLRTGGAGANPSWGGSAQVIVDRAYAEYTANADLTTVLPAHDTIPQVSQGTQILSVTITPKTTTNRLRISFQAQVSNGTAGTTVNTAICRDSAVNAIDARLVTVPGSNYAVQTNQVVEIVPGSTSATTISVRVGPSVGTIRMNGTTNGRLFGGVSRATLIVEEITA